MSEMYFQQLKCTKCGLIVQSIFPSDGHVCFDCLPDEVKEKIEQLRKPKQTQTKAG